MSYLIAFLLVISLLVACAPRVVPFGAPPTPSQTVPTSIPTEVTPSPASFSTPKQGSTEWDNVVAAAKKEGKVTPFSFFFSGDAASSVAQAFGSKYGIRIDPVTGTGSVLLERIRSEQVAKKFNADMFDTAAATVLTAKAMGLTQPIGDLPVFKETGSFRSDPHMDSDGHLIGLSPDFQRVFINTKLVKPEREPQSYKDFLNAEWSSKIVAHSPLVAPALTQLYVIGLRHGFLDPSFFTQLSKQNLILKGSTAEVQRALAQGEAHALIATATVGLAPLVKEGAPIKPVDMQEGTVIFLNPAMAMIKDAPHPNATRLFVNWLLSTEGQDVYHRAKAATPLRKDVSDYAPSGLQVQPKKLLLGDLDFWTETSRLQQEGTVARLMGMGK